MTTEPSGREDLAGLLEEIWIERTFSIARDHPNTAEALDKAHAAIINLEQERDDAVEDASILLKGMKKRSDELEQENAKLRGALKPPSLEHYPSYPAAFINAIAEEGTKAEAIEWLQKTWNELCYIKNHFATEALRADVREG